MNQYCLLQRRGRFRNKRPEARDQINCAPVRIENLLGLEVNETQTQHPEL